MSYQMKIVITTLAKREEAAKLGKAVIESGLAACVQVSGPMISIYKWKGKTEQDEEWQLKCKTIASTTHQLMEFIEKNHPYELPQIVAVPVTDVSAAYLHWAKEQCNTPGT